MHDCRSLSTKMRGLFPHARTTNQYPSEIYSQVRTMIYIYIYIQGPRGRGLRSVTCLLLGDGRSFEAFRRLSGFIHCCYWGAKGCIMEFRRSNKFFQRCFHHKYLFWGLWCTFFSIHADFKADLMEWVHIWFSAICTVRGVDFPKGMFSRNKRICS